MTTTDSTDVVVTEQPKHFKPRHPYQVLRALPKDATPAQQDSGIQATFQPKEVRYSNRPDTLHLPGYGKGKSALEVTPLPKYYKESFFANDTLFHPERSGGRYGVAGDTVPYTVRGDNAMTIILLVGFISMIISASESRRFIIKQLKSIFYLPKYFDGIKRDKQRIALPTVYGGADKPALCRDNTILLNKIHQRHIHYRLPLPTDGHIPWVDIGVFHLQSHNIHDSELDILRCEKKFTLAKGLALLSVVGRHASLPRGAIVVILQFEC